MYSRPKCLNAMLSLLHSGQENIAVHPFGRDRTCDLWNAPSFPHYVCNRMMTKVSSDETIMFNLLIYERLTLTTMAADV